MLYLAGLQCTASYTDFKNLPFDPATEYQKTVNQTQLERSCVLYFITKLCFIAKYTDDLHIQNSDTRHMSSQDGCGDTDNKSSRDFKLNRRTQSSSRVQNYPSSCNTQTTHIVEQSQVMPLCNASRT